MKFCVVTESAVQFFFCFIRMKIRNTNNDNTFYFPSITVFGENKKLKDLKCLKIIQI